MKRTALNPVDASVGQNIRRWRRKRGMTQKQLAARVGVTMQQIWKYEAATGRITVSRLVDVARALGVSVSAIISDDDDRKSLGLGSGQERNFGPSMLRSVPDLKLVELIKVISEISDLISEDVGDDICFGKAPLISAP